MLSFVRSVRVVLCGTVAPSLLVWVSSSWAVGTTQVVVQTGDAAPDANGSFFRFADPPALNDAGQAAFLANLTGTSGGGSDDIGIFRGDGTTLVQIAREGDAAPDANGSFLNFTFPVLNNAGQATFVGFLTGSRVGISDSSGIFRGDGTTLVQIVRKGEAAPDANGSFSSLVIPAFNDAGQAAFLSFLTRTSGGNSDDRGIFRGDGTTLVQIVREGDAAPDANGNFSSFNSPALNDAGQVAFSGSLTGTSGGGSDDRGIFWGDGATLTRIAREGEAAPDANGNFLLFSDPTLNNAGQAAFWGSLTGTSGGGSDDAGLFRGDGATLVQIVRKGDAAPDANGSFSGFADPPALNDAGQAAFFGVLTGTSDDRGLFFYDDGLGLIQVARKGDALLGSTITALDFSNGNVLGDERNGLNELGQVAYQFGLADGRSGIAIWTIPEPTALALIALASPLLLARRRN